MNEGKVVLLIVVIATVMMFLFPPTFTFHEEGLKGEYHFIANIPDGQKVNAPLLLVEWFGIILFSAIVWTLMNSRGKRRREEGERASGAASGSPGDAGESVDSTQAGTASRLDRSG